MGKRQHQKDKMYITCAEYTHFYGGKKAEIPQSNFRRLPFDHCSLSLQPFEYPVCTPDGIMFDLLNIIPWIKKYGTHPSTGEKLEATSLVKLNFAKNSDGKYHCPVLFSVFTNNSHIVAIKTTGNVFAYEAVEQLNIKTKSYKDLLTDEPFTRQDIITLQDPTNVDKFDVSSFFHVKNNLKVTDPDMPSQSSCQSPPKDTENCSDLQASGDNSTSEQPSEPPVKKSMKTKHTKEKSPEEREASEGVTEVFNSSEESEGEFCSFSDQQQDPQSDLVPDASRPCTLDSRPAETSFVTTQDLAQFKAELMSTFWSQLQQSASQMPRQRPRQRAGALRAQGSQDDPAVTQSPFLAQESELLDRDESGEKMEQGGAQELPLDPAGSEGEQLDEAIQDMAASHRLFQGTPFMPLLKSVMAVLDLEPPAEAQQPSTSKVASLFKEPGKRFISLPVPKAFMSVVEAECNCPMQRKRLSALSSQLYEVEEKFSNFFKVPVVDAPVASLVSHSLLPKAGGTQLKDVSERRIDSSLRRSYEASGRAAKASCTASIFSRAAVAWLDDLLDNPDTDPELLQSTLLNLRHTAAFVADATMDSTQLIARSVAAGVVARRSLWLQHWQADPAAKNNLATKPFKGELLFGEEALKDILVEKKMPYIPPANQQFRRPYRHFNPTHPPPQGQSFRGNHFSRRGRGQRGHGRNWRGRYFSRGQQYFVPHAGRSSGQQPNQY